MILIPQNISLYFEHTCPVIPATFWSSCGSLLLCLPEVWWMLLLRAIQQTGTLVKIWRWVSFSRPTGAGTESKWPCKVNIPHSGCWDSHNSTKKDIHQKGLPKLLQKMSWMTEYVCFKWGRVFCEGLIAMCLSL